MANQYLIKVDALYGFKTLRPYWESERALTYEQFLAARKAAAPQKCDYCGLKLTREGYKCVMCGAPK